MLQVYLMYKGLGGFERELRKGREDGRLTEKTNAKFFAIHVSPSESAFRVMGNTEQEQAETMKRYIRKAFIH